MRRFRLMVGSVCGAALLLVGINAQSEQVLSQNVVGYYNITLESGMNLVAFPFQKIPVAQGVINANTDTTITVTDAGWAADFGYSEPGESTFYVEIKNGPFEGRYMYIASHTSDQLTLIPGQMADIGINDLQNAGFKVVPANRVRDLFGDPTLYGEDGGSQLQGGGTAAQADNIIQWTGNSWAGSIHLNTLDIPGFGLILGEWYRGSVKVSDNVIGRDEALFVRRRGVDPVVLTVVGEVSANAQQVVLTQGMNLVGGLAVVSEPLNSTHLSDLVTGGGTAAAADNIIEWTGSSWGGSIHLNTLDIPGFGLIAGEWYRGSQNVHNDVVLDPTRGYFIRVRQEPEHAQALWVRPSPLAVAE